MPVGIAELMLRDVALLSRDASVQEAAQAMAESDCRVVLIGHDDVVEGLLTEHDILIRLVAAGLAPDETPVSAIMSSVLFTCRDDQSAEEASDEMAEHRINQMPVLDRAGRFVGLLPRAELRSAMRGGEAAGPGREAAEPAV